MGRSARVLPFLRTLGDEYMRALRHCLAGPRSHAPLLMGALLAGWWLYVPLHELLHVAGCVWTGGTVTRLELEPMYGARLLQKVFPFVSSGSEYAGRLSGFDTRGSDFTYLATDAMPFVLTPLLGFPLLGMVARRTRPAASSALWFGLSLPFAFAPVLALFGDYFEMGTVLVSRAASSLGHPAALERWRGDDPGVVLESLAPSGVSALDVFGLALSFAVGVVLVLGTLWLGQRVSARLNGSA